MNRPVPLTIDPDGNVRAGDPEAMRALGAFAGEWLVTETMPSMLVLQRRGKEGTPPLLMAGRIRGLGWLVEIVNLIATARLTGLLAAYSDGVQRELSFESGALRMANSTSTRDLIGEYLVGEGVITRGQLEKALSAQTPGKRLGEVLVEQGLVRQDDVYGMLVRRTERICHDTIVLSSGSYCFAAVMDVGRLPALLYLDTQAVLMEAMRQLDEGTRLGTAVLGRRETVGKALPDEDTVSMQRFMQCVDGKRSVADITHMLSLGRLEAVRVARQLTDRGRVEVVGEASDARDLRAIVGRFNEALATIYAAARDVLPGPELTDACRQYIKSGGHGNRTLQRLALESDGRLSLDSVIALAEAGQAEDPLRLTTMVLTQYASFVLFTANARLPSHAQAALAEKVNGMLSTVFSAVM
jgi:hypothetical protein